MNYETLRVYKSAFELLMLVYKKTPKMKREYKYTLAEEAKRSLQEAIVCIYQANLRNVGRVENISRARDYIVRFRVLFRIMEGLKQLSIKDVVIMGSLTADIFAQLKKWEAYTRAAAGKST